MRHRRFAPIVNSLEYRRTPSGLSPQAEVCNVDDPPLWVDLSGDPPDINVPIFVPPMSPPSIGPLVPVFTTSS